MSHQEAVATYHYADDVNNVEQSKIYYRIYRWIEMDQKHYSNIVVFSLEKAMTVSMKAYPNPVNDHFTLVISSPVDEVIQVCMADMNGRGVMEKRLHVLSGNNNFEFSDLSSLATGVYLIKTKIMGEIHAVRLVKE